MSEPLAERLSRFTPDSAGLDCDALLFAAGRASARPSRTWKGLAAVLAASQMLTLVLLWPRTPPQSAPSAAVVAEMPAVVPELPPAVLDSSSLGVLRQRLLADDGDWPSPVSDGPMVPDDPPLRVFDALPSTIIN